VPESFLLAASALFQANFMLRGLQVDTARMRRNLDLTGGLIVAEAVMMGLAPAIGRQHAHDVVYEACRIAIEDARTLYDVLVENTQIRAAFSDAQLKALTDPANYLGAAAAMARSVAAQGV
jgi:3-carboxy-cis,cis-muconate cycloisomerase